MANPMTNAASLGLNLSDPYGFDRLPIGPNGQTVATTPDPERRRYFADKCGFEDAHTAPMGQLLSRYAAHLNEIGEKARREAIAVHVQGK